MTPANRPRAETPRDGRHADLRGGARERVLEAAAAEFAERGFGGASLQAIAKRAGLTRGAIYWNFRDKQDLFLTLIDERVDQPARALMKLTETAPADTETAADVSAGLARLISEQAPLILLLFEHWAAAARDPKLRRAFNARQRNLRDLLARALQARHDTTGVPLTYPADRLATAVLALAYGTAMTKLVDPKAIPDALPGEVLDLLYDGLASRAEAESRRRGATTGSSRESRC